MRRKFKGFKRKLGTSYRNAMLKVSNFICEKKTYLTQKDAKIALKRIRESESDDDHVKPIRTYECKRCSGWHLTSKTVEEYKMHKHIWDKNKIIRGGEPNSTLDVLGVTDIDV